MDRRAALQRPKVREWLGGFKITVFRVFGHSDDFIGLAVEYEAPAHSLIASRILTSHCAIDDHDSRRGGVISQRELAPLQQRNP